MNVQREHFRSTVEHRPTGRFLFYAYFTPHLDGLLRAELGLGESVDLQEHFGMFKPEYVFPRAPESLCTPDYGRYYKDVVQPPGSRINEIGVLEIPGSVYHFTRYVSPLRSAETFRELEEYPYPNVRDYSFEHLKTEVERIHARGHVAGIGVGHIYETAWQIRGYERFLEDMLLAPEKCEYILDRLTERNIQLAEAAARAGCDSIMVGDDVANQRTLMFSKELWRKFLKPRWAAVYQAARSIRPDIQVWYHSDGNILELVPEMLDIGVSILNPIQPECMDPVAVKRVVGRRAILDGSVGTQSTMPFGTPSQVRALVKERIETLGYDGGLILSPTHVLEPEVPVANVLAFIEAVREFNGA